MLALARQLLAGERVGAVPEIAGQPPLVADFRITAERLEIELDRIRGEKGGNAVGNFDVTFGTGDRVTGNFNAEFCDIAVAPSRPSCE